MFRAIWSKTLRDYRVPMLSYGFGFLLVILAIYGTYGKQTGDPASKASLEQLAQTFRFVNDPIAIATPDGFITWRALGFFLPGLMGLWALLAGTRMVRGEEEQGSMDLLMATPHSRIGLLVEKLIAFVVALLVIGLLAALGVMLGQKSTDIAIETGRDLLMGLNISLVGLFFGSLALLLSQLLRSRGAAAGWTGAILGLSIVVDAAGRSIDNGVWLRRFSPLYYYNINKPLIESYQGNNIGAALLLLLLSVVFLAVSGLLFVKRDLGSSAMSLFRQTQPERRRVSVTELLGRAQRDLSCRDLSLRFARTLSTSTFWWLLSLFVFVYWITTIIPMMLTTLHQLIAGNPVLAQLYGKQNLDSGNGFLGGITFQFVPLLVIIFIFILALQWASSLDNGRFELILSTPNSRTRTLLSHVLVVGLIAVVTAGLLYLAVLAGAWAVNLKIDSEKVLAACVGLLPLELLAATFTYALAGRVRAVVLIAIISAYLVIAYLAETLNSLLKLPEWVMSFSILHVYGNPVMDGWRWGPWGALLAIAAGLLVLAVIQFNQSDLERG